MRVCTRARARVCVCVPFLLTVRLIVSSRRPNNRSTLSEAKKKDRPCVCLSVHARVCPAGVALRRAEPVTLSLRRPESSRTTKHSLLPRVAPPFPLLPGFTVFLFLLLLFYPAIDEKGGERERGVWSEEREG